MLQPVLVFAGSTGLLLPIVRFMARPAAVG